MSQDQPKNPLHGLTLESIVTYLVENIGWDQLGSEIDIRCFNYDPSIKSSLKFLRKTPWARKKVEGLYLCVLRNSTQETSEQETPDQETPDQGATDKETTDQEMTDQETPDQEMTDQEMTVQETSDQVDD